MKSPASAVNLKVSRPLSLLLFITSFLSIPSFCLHLLRQKSLYPTSTESELRVRTHHIVQRLFDILIFQSFINVRQTDFLKTEKIRHLIKSLNELALFL